MVQSCVHRVSLGMGSVLSPGLGPVVGPLLGPRVLGWVLGESQLGPGWVPVWVVGLVR